MFATAAPATRACAMAQTPDGAPATEVEHRGGWFTTAKEGRDKYYQIPVAQRKAAQAQLAASGGDWSKLPWHERVQLARKQPAPLPRGWFTKPQAPPEVSEVEPVTSRDPPNTSLNAALVNPTEQPDNDPEQLEEAVEISEQQKVRKGNTSFEAPLINSDDEEQGETAGQQPARKGLGLFAGRTRTRGMGSFRAANRRAASGVSNWTGDAFPIQQVGTCCCCLCCCATFVGLIVSKLLYPGVLEWIGIFAGILLWCLGTGMVCAGFSGGIAESNVGAAACAFLFGFVLTPLVWIIVPFGIVCLVWCSAVKEDMKTRAIMTVIPLAIMAGDAFATYSILARMCAFSNDSPCVGGPRGPSDNPLVPQVPAQATLSVDNWLDTSRVAYNVHETSLSFRRKHTVSCVAKGQPFRYSASYELLHDGGIIERMDQRTIYKKSSIWDTNIYDVHDCSGTLRWILREHVHPCFGTTWSCKYGTVSWDIHDGSDKLIATTDTSAQWDLLQLVPKVNFLSADDSTVIGTVQQHGSWFGQDTWTISVAQPTVVEPTVYGYIANIIKYAQLEDRNKNSNKREQHIMVDKGTAM